MGAVAGFVAGHVAHPGKELGAAYDQAMKARVFAPLGMRTTTFDPKQALKQNHAEPHGEDVAGKVALATNDVNVQLTHLRPTGGAWSSAREMERYVQLELANGDLPNGKRLVSEANLLERRKKQVAIGEDMHYGMGLRTDMTWGVPIVQHGGSLLGYQSQMFWLPEQGIGAVILTNADSGVLVTRPIL